MDLRELPGAPFVTHPWETARANFFCRVLNRHVVVLGRPLRVLDIGAGDGVVASALLAALPTGSTVICYDPHYSDEHLRRLQISVVPGLTFSREPPGDRFDLLLLLDVLEHVEDDGPFLRESVKARLLPDGAVLVSVPAYMALFTRHDVALNHHRRYSAASLRATLAAAGLRPAFGGGLFHCLVAPRALAKLAELLHGVRSRPAAGPPSDHAATDIGTWSAGAAVTSAVRLALAADNAVSLLAARVGVELPGLSLWSLAKKA